MISNGEWEITKVTASDEEVKLHCCPEAYSTITYELHLSRMTLYYMLYIILPLASLVLLFLLVFHLEDGERMGFGITVLLSITVYLLVISEKLPEKSDKTPMLGVCFIVEFYFLCFGLVSAALTVNLSKRSNQKPPQFLLNLTLKYNNFSITPTPIQKNVELSLLNGENANNDQIKEEEEKPKVKEEMSNSEQWKKVARFLDKVLTVVFAFIIFITPLLVSISISS